MRRRSFLAALLGAAAGDPFAAKLDELREQYLIAGLSAGVVRRKKLAWARGFGYANREEERPARPDTPYRIASVTKPIAATILLQLVEQHRLSLDEPATQYLPAAQALPRSVRIRHLLTHTSEGAFSYSADRFALLTNVMERKFGKPFREVMAARILDPCRMTRSVPGQDSPEARYEAALADLARLYHFDSQKRIVPAEYPRWRAINASAGLITTVEDLARFDSALDRALLIHASMLRRAWTPPPGNPYGFGWYVQVYQGTRLVWHYGWWPGAFSSLYLKVPEKQVTLILLANGDGLSRNFPLSGGDVRESPFAREFLATL